MNEASEIKITLNAVKDCSSITEQLETFIESLPDENTLKIFNDSIFEKMSKEDMISYIAKKLYYCSV